MSQDAARSKFPIIVDDLETSLFGLSFEGKQEEDQDLLAGAGLTHIYDEDCESTSPETHDTSSVEGDNMYVAQPRQGLDQPQLQQFDIPYSDADDASYPPTIFTDERQADGSPPYNGLQAHHPMPDVTDWTPHEGPAGTEMVVMLASAYELDPLWHFEVHFEEQVAPCTLTMTSLKGVYYELALSLEVPPAPEAAWTNPKLPLSLEAKDASGTSMGVTSLGMFTYHGTARRNSTQSSPALSRKRRRSVDVAESMPTKRLATEHLRAVSESAYEQQPFGYITQSPSMVALDTTETPPPPPRHFHRQTSSVPTSAPSHLHRGSPQASAWTHASTASPQLGGSASRKADGLSPIVVNPKLCRTTTLQQSPSPSATPMGTPATTAAFNPYAMVPYNKAMLKVNGDLEEMTQDWSDAENEAGRRLVHFWRNQTGSTINASFKPVTPEDRQPSFICISCIWWEAKGEHFVTSVDTIYLLENLVGGRFTVEEKNRIRRNLEGFRPLTVSKGKSDSEDFFKLIMGFPNPKPRNIEKDVKVFPWKILGHALKKIMGKYSASYSSMASALPTTAAPPSFPAGTSEIQNLMGAPAINTNVHAVSSVETLTGYETSHLLEQRMVSLPVTYAPMTAPATAQAGGYALYGYPTPTGLPSAPASMSMASPASHMMAPSHHHHAQHHHIQHVPRPTPPHHAHTHPLPVSHGGHYPHVQTPSARPGSSASWDFSATGTPFVESPVTVSHGLDMGMPPHAGSVSGVGVSMGMVPVSGTYFTMPAADA